MKIVVLDGYVLNPGDLSWDGIKKLGDCTIPLTPNIATENQYFHTFYPKQFSSTDVL